MGTSAPLSRAMIDRKLFLIGVPAVFASAVFMGIVFSPIGKAPKSGAPSQASSQHQLQTTVDNSMPATTDDSQAVLVSNPSESPVRAFVNANTTNPVSVSLGSVRSQSENLGESLVANEADGYQPHIPLVFLDYTTHALPATEEVAAAVQKLQQDFMDSTGAAKADPADPDFADRWNQFQPTSHERFYAIFGVEAFNALSIMEARQRGGF
jgi:hypothetical protein